MLIRKDIPLKDKLNKMKSLSEIGLDMVGAYHCYHKGIDDLAN